MQSCWEGERCQSLVPGARPVKRTEARPGKRTNKKTDVPEYQSVFRHVGLLCNEPPVSRVVPYLVVRQSQSALGRAAFQDHSGSANATHYIVGQETHK
jgi:hypothetical protein